MSNLELLVPAVGQLISVTRGDHDQSVLSDTDTLRQQRLSDRDKHHHKQLWTKHPHGGQYRKVVSAKKTEVTLQTIEPGYEKPKSGPTTNFVGNHMTQGAIDLVQAELSPPADLSLLLLKDTPYQQPQLIAVGCHEPTAPEHKTISNYTWWDSGDFICVSVPTEALLSGSASHLQCCIKEMQIQCTIEVAFAGAQPTHHRLAVPYLHAAVQPEQSSCFLNGSSLQASTVSTAQASSMLYCHTNSSTLTHVHCLDKPCSPGLTSPSHQPCSSASTDIHASQHAAQGKQQSLQAGFPAAESSGSMVLAQKSKNPCLLLKLRKSDPNNTWCTLAGQAPAKNSIKQVPPSPESMAALRRALIQQRQQKQARGVSACSASAATSWPGRPIGCVHLPQDAQAASCPSESGTMSQSESVQMTPVTAADGMLTSPGDEAVLLQHHTFNFEDLKSEAEAEARRGAYQDAVLSYTVMLQRLGTVSNTEKAHIHCCLAGCLMQTGQLKLAVEECNGAVACAQGLADVSMLVSALRQRAMVYQQLEAYHLSLQDFCCILQLQPGNIAAQQARCRLRMLVELQF
ncbi:TPA: hypothetical protein ACH3X3_014649 [Trebouxia sp. C0006]